LILYFQHDKFHWVSKLWESFNTLDKWAVELCNRKWILMCSFSQLIFFYIYQLRIGTKLAFEFHNYRSVQTRIYIIYYTNPWCKSVLFNQIWKLKKSLKLFYEHVQIVLVKLLHFIMFDLSISLSRIEATRNRVTRLILTPGQM
jgi:hypothetical protein